MTGPEFANRSKHSLLLKWKFPGATSGLCLRLCFLFGCLQVHAQAEETSATAVCAKDSAGLTGSDSATEHPADKKPAAEEATAQPPNTGGDNTGGEAPNPDNPQAKVPVQAQTKEARTQIEWLGQRYLLGRSQHYLGSSNDEYYLEAEGPENWTQLLSVQKIDDTRPELVLGNLRHAKQVLFETLHQDSTSSVLRLREGEGADGREGVLLIQKVSKVENATAVITYLLKPSKVEAGLARLQLEAWKERLLAQARSPGFGRQKQWTQNP